MRHATLTALGLCCAACGPVPPPSPITFGYAAQVAAPGAARITFGLGDHEASVPVSSPARRLLTRSVRTGEAHDGADHELPA